MPIWQLCANLLIPNCLRSNLSYSPLAALELYVIIGDTKNVALELSVDTYTKEEFRKLHLPDGMSFPVEQQGNGGCLSFIIMLLIPTITLLYFL